MGGVQPRTVLGQDDTRALPGFLPLAIGRAWYKITLKGWPIYQSLRVDAYHCRANSLHRRCHKGRLAAPDERAVQAWQPQRHRRHRRLSHEWSRQCLLIVSRSRRSLGFDRRWLNCRECQ
eukprot:scaffold18012_cov117-Isochrysis_galbana.AAC.5